MSTRAELDRQVVALMALREEIRAAAQRPVETSPWTRLGGYVLTGIGTLAVSVLLNWNLVNWRLGKVEVLAERNSSVVHTQELALTKLGSDLLNSMKNTEAEAKRATELGNANTTTVQLMRSEQEKLREECKRCAR